MAGGLWRGSEESASTSCFVGMAAFHFGLSNYQAVFERGRGGE
jgi:hypothetical protein